MGEPWNAGIWKCQVSIAIQLTESEMGADPNTPSLKLHQKWSNNEKRQPGSKKALPEPEF